MRTGWSVIVVEHPDAVSGVARALLSMADSPADVLTQRGGMEFLVPEELADRYRKSLNRLGRDKKRG